MLIERIFDLETGEVTERPYTEEEIAENEANALIAAADVKKINDAIAAKRAVFEKLGLTDEEINLILS